MKDKQESHSYLDGKRLYYSFLAGSYNVFENQKMLNKINVFPVPDADTGTNLASTFRSIVENIQPDPNVKVTSTAIANAAIMGARGNSGIIIAQFLYGLSNELEDLERISLRAFSEAIMKAVSYAYQAISNPVEGTIITVLREWAEYIYMLRDKFETFEQLMSEALVKAQESLARTPEILKMLAKSKVVDAGAKGFVIFLEGIDQFNQKENIKKILSYKPVSIEEEAFIEDSHEESKFRYCTEALVSLKENIKKEEIKAFLEQQGDSLVIAGSEERMRIHIHTNEPAGVFAHLSGTARIMYQKVDDMVKQRLIARHRKHTTALVIDSTCDIPQEIIDEKQINMIPLNVFFGETQFLDKLTINTEKFFEILEDSEVYPTSSQPAIKDFTNTYSYLATHYDEILALHISEALSGTFSNSKQAAQKISQESGKAIYVTNTKSTCGGSGLIALRAAECIEQGTELRKIRKEIPQWIENTKFFVCSQSLDSYIKGGRISKTKGFFGKLLNTKPIIAGMPDGKIAPIDKAFTYKSSIKKLLSQVVKYMEGKTLWKYNVIHCQNPETAEIVAREMESITGKAPAYIMQASPVLSISAGKGAVAVSVMLD